MKFVSMAVLFVALSLSGCAMPRASVTTALTPRGHPQEAGIVAVPFLMVQENNIDSDDEIREDSALTDRFVTALLDQGFNVLDRSYIKETLTLNDMKQSDLFNEDNIRKIGTLLGANTIVLGRYTIVKQDGQIHEKKLNIRAMAVPDGQVVFSMSVMDTSLYRNMSAEQMVDDAVQALMKPSNEKESSPPKASKKKKSK